MINRASPVSPDDVYNMWEKECKETYSCVDGVRFKANTRREALQNLCDYFIYAKFSIDDIKLFKKRALDLLLSDAGKKRKRHHANGKWASDSEVDFDQIVADNFVRPLFERENYGPDYLPFSQNIADWVKQKFGEESEGLVKEAHKLNGALLIQYAQESFYKSND